MVVPVSENLDCLRSNDEAVPGKHTYRVPLKVLDNLEDHSYLFIVNVALLEVESLEVLEAMQFAV